ncbi:MAG: hypothetical protein C5B58_03395 [Acidobacteria bacterium]|nr:MAG: hypothetical protein C5B58_03395 [Acidobacteriota bacterium]
MTPRRSGDRALVLSWPWRNIRWDKDQARKTLAIAIQSHDWSAAKANDHNAWIEHVLRREAEEMIQRAPGSR